MKTPLNFWYCTNIETKKHTRMQMSTKKMEPTLSPEPSAYVPHMSRTCPDYTTTHPKATAEHLSTKPHSINPPDLQQMPQKATRPLMCKPCCACTHVKRKMEYKHAVMLLNQQQELSKCESNSLP